MVRSVLVTEDTHHMTTLRRHSLSLAARARGLMALATLTGSERARRAAYVAARSAYLAARRDAEMRRAA